MTRGRALRIGAALAVLVPLGAACGDDDEDVSEPVIVDIDELDGSTVRASEEQVIDVDVGDSDVTAWEAVIEDGSVVRFVAGRVDGDATYNPGFEARSSGQTAVSMSDGATSVAFTINVTQR